MEVTIKNKGIKIENFTFCRNFPTKETKKIKITHGYGSYAQEKKLITLSSGQKIKVQIVKEVDIEILKNTLETFLNGKYSYPIYTGLLNKWQEDAKEAWKNLLPEIFIAVAKKYEQELLILEKHAGFTHQSYFTGFDWVSGSSFFFFIEHGEIYIGEGDMNPDAFHRLNPFEVHLKVRKNEIVETEVKEYLRGGYWTASIEKQYHKVDNFMINI